MVIPVILVWLTGANIEVVTALLGAALIGLGLVLVVWTVRLFVTLGKGTLAPWDATTKLVVRGPYRHIRNPMIAGVACVLAGEVALFG